MKNKKDLAFGKVVDYLLANTESRQDFLKGHTIFQDFTGELVERMLNQTKSSSRK